MPKLKNCIPKYRKHGASGQAVVTLNGVDHYLGPHGTRVSKAEYDRLIAEWLQRGRILEVEAESITVSELVLRFIKWGKVHYRKNGTDTGTLDNHKAAFRILRRFYSRKPANEFGPKRLKTLQNAMIGEDWSRRTVNDRIQSIKFLFRWGVAEELINPSVSHGLDAVRGLQRGRTAARETAPIKPVDDAVVEATLLKLPKVVADMVRLQRLTGARPAEICTIRPCDVDQSGEVWIYRPASHKTEHHGQRRFVAIGPQAQDVLRPYLLRHSEDYCFCPHDSEKKRLRLRHQNRVTPLSCGNRPGSKTTAKRKRPAGAYYSTDSYRRAIVRAADKAKVEPWSPNQLRHSAATLIRSKFGLEAAQVALGHTKAATTEIYAERDMQKALEVARQIG